ncbi:DNA-3-methyladenine glycosylase [Alkalicoccus daliensis]|uniref:Putative 3-methyladenine DNA glycosylase n=1 Tax=Alkalicoccus daliensis TaxID=745820 RepID=A0A1H0IYI8_9BACI|nr:DNA-3-methyladenine glycosylase [Alkalicoccus daliensis]SDO36567.1 DNA-3-methyladenine glycosylase [Alkalicoccus daliensis]
MALKPLPAAFYHQETLDLAQALLGKILIKETPAGTAAGRIIETEAYKGPLDQAAHSYRNRRTKRTEVMFGPCGHTYTYVMHTHCLFNVVSAAEGIPEAILVRGVEPVLGKELMFERRGHHHKEINLTSGPGKLTKALGITMDDYGKALTDSDIYIAAGDQPVSISAGPRIGIDNSGEAKDYPWRYWETGNRFVSR